MSILPAESIQNAELPLGRLRARSPRQAGNLGVNRVKDGLTIASLRATGGPPGGAALEEATGATLRDLPLSGEEFVSQTQGQVRNASPLLAGLSPLEAEGSEGTPSLAVLQARQLGIRQRLQTIDTRSRLLQAQGNPRRTDRGFGVHLVASQSLDLVA